MIIKETSRLRLRTPRIEDAADFEEMFRDEVILKYNAMRVRFGDELVAYLNEHKEDTQFIVLEHKNDQRAIGNISLHPDYLRYGVKSINLSYYIHTHYAGQGFMREALLATLDYCFHELDLDLVVARVFTPNVRSNHIMRKLGFTLEGTLKHAVKAYKDVIYDDNLYCLTKAEYHQLYPPSLVE